MELRVYITNTYKSPPLLDQEGGCCRRGRGRGAVSRAVSQQQLLLSGTTRPADVLAVGVVEAQEGQDGLDQPQSCHTPQGRLGTRGEV